MALIQGQAVTSSSAGGFYPKTINGSLRFDSADSAHLEWTPSGAGTSGTTFTLSCWVKLAALAENYIFSAAASGATHEIFYVQIRSSGHNYSLHVIWRDGSTTTRTLKTNRTFKDPSAWYHIVVAVDAGASRDVDKMKVYVNGVLETDFSTDNRSTLSSSSSLAATANVLHYIGGYSGTGDTFADFYLAEYFFIDGTQHEATDFGEFNNGTWVPKNITASSFTMGNNGFYLNFEDDAEVDAFNTVLYEGDGNATHRISGAGFQPDFVWIKGRSFVSGHQQYDSVRGATKRLQSHSQNAQDTQANGLKSFDSDGFTVGSLSTSNTNNADLVAWCWDAGGASQSNTYVVKVVSDNGNKYRFDDFGTSEITLRLSEGGTYRFDQSDSSNSGHPLRFSTTLDGTHNSGSEYTTGVTTNGTPGSAGAYTEITVAADAPTLYYYCSSHSGMGGQVNTESLKGYTNVDGTTQSTVVASDTTGFSTVIYTGTGANATVGHGLSSAPDWIIFKNRTDASDWAVYHTAVGNTTITTLNSSSAPVSANSVYFQNTDPSNSVITLGSSNVMNGSGDDMVAYCWTETAGVSKFGSYSGNGSTTGPTVTCGFKPAWIMIRRTDTGNNWVIQDNTRVTINPNNQTLLADRTDAETDFSIDIDFNSNGFQIKSAGNPENNASGTYMYMAFADTRSAAFWLDQSSNNNDWQPENLDYMDSLSDSPTTNYPTLNPLSLSGQTLSNGNLQVIGSDAAWRHCRATQSPLTGKWYCEVEIIFENDGATDRIGVGVANADAFSQQNLEPTTYLGQTADSWAYFENGTVYNNASNTGSTGTTYTAGDVIGMALDLDSSPQTITWYKNGTQVVQKDLALGTALTGRWTFGVTTFHIGEGLINFGQQPFLYTPPSGYEALNTTNMPDPIIDPSEGDEPRDYFETFTYTGNGTGLQVGDVIKEPAVTGIIDKSLIFDDGSSHYLSATAGSADTTFTVSMWFKRCNIPTQYMYLFSSANAGIALNNSTGKLYVYNGSGTAGPFDRDIKDNFWHHVVYSQSSGSFTLYLDGIQIGTGTGFTINTTANHINIGRYEHSSTYYFDGYIADVNFVSGTALNATSFGAFDANGIWSPIEPSVTYGSSGYRLQFEDATSTTTLGNDTSGNNNDFTLNNMATSDQVTDSPTNDFCILNPNKDILSANGNGVISDGNLKCTWSATNRGNRIGTIGLKSGKWYFEADYIDNSNSTFSIGFISDYTITNQYDGVKSDISTGGIKSVAVDLDNNLIWFAESGTFVGNPAAGTGGTAIESGYQRFPTIRDNSSSTGDALTVICNFGQNGTFLGQRTAGGNTDSNGEGDFFYTPPTGFLALCENNISNDDNLESPNWVWIKDRSATADHKLFTTLRGVQKSLEPNEATNEAEEPNTLVDFNKNGFTVGNDATVNTSGNNYVAWCWANITESWSNDASATGIGDYDSSGIRGGKTGVSIFTYAGRGTGSTSIRNKFAHGLVDENGTAVIPELFWFKGLDTGTTYGAWLIQGNAFDNGGSGGGDILKLDTNAARISNAASTNTQWTNQWVELDYSRSANLNGTDNICFAFRSVEGFSKIGKYYGNESATAGNFVYTGFKPAWIMVKNITSTGNWVIHDNTRTPGNSFTSASGLFPDVNNAEGTDTTLRADFFSNGFVMYSGSNSYNNTDNAYLYMAFAEQPFKYANAR